MIITSQELQLHMFLVGLPAVSLLVGYAIYRYNKYEAYKRCQELVKRCDAKLACCAKVHK